MKNAVTTTHKLDFEVADWYGHEKIKVFRVGSCHGQWFWLEVKGFGQCLCLLSVMNEFPGNGHLEDVFQWFENSAKRAKVPFMMMDFENQAFKKHCIEKRGFEEVIGTDHIVKFF